MLFAVGSTLVNCTNSYEVEKPDPQMVELAKYAKQHVPEEHPKVLSECSFVFRVELALQSVSLRLNSICSILSVGVFLYSTKCSCLKPFVFLYQDAPSYVEKRLGKLLEAGVVSALVCMVKQESPALTEACKECIAR